MHHIVTRNSDATVNLETEKILHRQPGPLRMRAHPLYCALSR